MKDTKAIVFCSNTGFTETYARFLAEDLELPVFSLKQAQKHLSKGDSIFFLGWVLGSHVSGLDKARKVFDVKGVVAVGLHAGEEAAADVRRISCIGEEDAFFLLPGGLALEKLHGLYKLLFKMGSKAMAQGAAQGDMETYKMLTEGANFVDRKYLKPVISWFRK